MSEDPTFEQIVSEDITTLPSVTVDNWRAIFPDIETLVGEATKQVDELRVAQVPRTPVFVLYAIQEPHDVEVLCVRTYQTTAVN